MRVVFYTNNISPHQLPLAREVMRRVGCDNFLYVGEEIAWRGKVVDVGDVRTLAGDDSGAQEWLENADVMYVGGLRPIELLERRAKRGLRSFYYSERWFKPVGIVSLFGLFDCSIPGWVRTLVPGYRKMAKRFVRLANENACVKVLPIGPWSRRDFLRLGVRDEKLVDWGYFVEKGTGSGKWGTVKPNNLQSDDQTVFRILWAGRMLSLGCDFKSLKK